MLWVGICCFASAGFASSVQFCFNFRASKGMNSKQRLDLIHDGTNEVVMHVYHRRAVFDEGS